MDNLHRFAVIKEHEPHNKDLYLKLWLHRHSRLAFFSISHSMSCEVSSTTRSRSTLSLPFLFSPLSVYVPASCIWVLKIWRMAVEPPWYSSFSTWNSSLLTICFPSFHQLKVGGGWKKICENFSLYLISWPRPSRWSSRLSSCWPSLTWTRLPPCQWWAPLKYKSSVCMVNISSTDSSCAGPGEVWSRSSARTLLPCWRPRSWTGTTFLHRQYLVFSLFRCGSISSTSSVTLSFSV